MIEVGKTYRTLDGAPARIYAVECGGLTPVHGAVLNGDAKWIMKMWTADGCNMDPERNLVEVKPRFKLERWVNVYPDNALGNYTNRSDADVMASADRIACIKVVIEGEEGQFDE